MRSQNQRCRRPARVGWANRVGAIGSIAALALQMVMPLVHRAGGAAVAGGDHASLAAPAKAGTDPHDAASCPACRMLRHAGHVLGLPRAGTPASPAVAALGRAAVGTAPADCLRSVSAPRAPPTLFS
jgi:hypothetical protein